jgi:hypothetical protein
MVVRFGIYDFGVSWALRARPSMLGDESAFDSAVHSAFDTEFDSAFEKPYDRGISSALIARR